MNDLEFIQRCVNGDRQALDEFVDRYSRLIYSYIHGVLRIKGSYPVNQETVNDLFQEIFLFLAKDNFKKLRSFKGKNGCSLASWVRLLVVNFVIDHVRKARTVVSLDEEQEAGRSLKDAVASGAISVKETSEEEEKVRLLKECMKRLRTDDKYFLELFFNSGLSAEELKQVFGISRPAAQMRKSRILERLRDCFRLKGYEVSGNPVSKDSRAF